MKKGCKQMKGAIIPRGEHRRHALIQLVVALVTAMMLAVTAIPGPVMAANRDDLARSQAQKRAEINKLKANLEGVSADISAAAVTLYTTRQQIPLAEAELATAQAELSAAQREAEAKAALLAAAQNELTDIKAAVSTAKSDAQKADNSLAEIARSTYRGETVPSAVDLLLNTTSPAEFTNAYRVNEALTRTQTTALAQYEQQAGQARNRQARQEAVEERVTELKQEADELVQVQAEKQAAAEQKRDKLKSLEATIAEKSALLESKKGDIQASIDEEQAEYNRVSAQIAAIDAENRRKAELAAKQAQSSGANSGGGGSGSGFIQSPVRGKYHLTSPYGWRINPVTKRRSFHSGTDLGVPCGTAQYAAAPGTVASAGWTSAGGNTITINHGYANGASWVTRYMHFSKLNVRSGQQVNRNTVIGYTGTTGWSTGCHMHFEVWKNGSTVNSVNYLGGHYYY